VYYSHQVQLFSTHYTQIIYHFRRIWIILSSLTGNEKMFDLDKLWMREVAVLIGNIFLCCASSNHFKCIDLSERLWPIWKLWTLYLGIIVTLYPQTVVQSIQRKTIFLQLVIEHIRFDRKFTIIIFIKFVIYIQCLQVLRQDDH
jgi:hypothetical protein